MKCPRCGKEMEIASHRKYPVNMCYECGYTEGRRVDANPVGPTNYEHMKTLNYNELVAFLSDKLGVEATKLADWLNDPAQ